MAETKIKGNNAEGDQRIGPSFGDELIAAGCNDGVAWGATGADIFVEPASGNLAAVQMVWEKHDPRVAGSQLEVSQEGAVRAHDNEG